MVGSGRNSSSNSRRHRHDDDGCRWKESQRMTSHSSCITIKIERLCKRWTKRVLRYSRNFFRRSLLRWERNWHFVLWITITWTCYRGGSPSCCVTQPPQHAINPLRPLDSARELLSCPFAERPPVASADKFGDTTSEAGGRPLRWRTRVSFLANFAGVAVELTSDMRKFVIFRVMRWQLRRISSIFNNRSLRLKNSLGIYYHIGVQI